ncbi:MAG: alginate export family protein [Planctomycetes bacterium]|nr:alginate export family protein [Planctomycetota bacterium]
MMKNVTRFVALMFAVLVGAAPLMGEEKSAGATPAAASPAPAPAPKKTEPAAKPAPESGKLAEAMDTAKKSVTASGEFRVRGTFVQNRDFNSASRFPVTGTAGNTKDAQNMVEQRIRVNLEAEPTANLKAHVTIQDARIWGGESTNTNRGTNTVVTAAQASERLPAGNVHSTDPQTQAQVAGTSGNELDLYEGYLDLKPDLGADFDLSLRVGRQTAKVAAGRYVSEDGWNNNGNVFDGVSGSWNGKEMAGVPVSLNTGYFRVVDTGNVMRSDDRSLWTLSLTADPYEGMAVVEPYYLQNKDRQRRFTGVDGRAGELMSNTAGGRVSGKAFDGRLDYEGEGSRQFGRWGTDDLRAWRWDLSVGYTMIGIDMKPRVGVAYSQSSGDTNAADSEVNTPDLLYPDSHKGYGVVDLVGPRNLNDLSFSLGATLLDGLTAGVDWHHFQLHEGNDRLYGPTGNIVFGTPKAIVPAGKSATRTVGDELDLILSYRCCNWLTLEAAYAHIFAGQYLRQVSTRGNDLDYAHLMLTVEF